MSFPPVPLPAYFGAHPKADVFFVPYSNEGKAIRTKVLLTHHLLSLIQEGEKEVIVSARRERVDASQLMLLTATPSIMSEHSLQGRPMRSMLVFFSPVFLLEFCVRHNVKPRGAGSSLLPLPQDDFTRHFARSIALLDHAVLNTDPALARIKLEEVLLYLYKKHAQQMAGFFAAALRSETDLPLRQAVLHHQDSNLTVPELAFLCHMSVSTFKRRFQEVFNRPPGRYFHERRMERAKALLERKQRPSEIYLLLGYESLSSFSTEFKKHFGVAPREHMHGSLA